MKKTLIMALFALFLATNAQADGQFSGLYAGINLGLSHSQFTASPIPGDGYSSSGCGGTCYSGMGWSHGFDSPTLSDNAFTGGIQAGYNWQFGQYVVGVEAEINKSSHSVRHGISNCDSGDDFCTSTITMDSFGTIRARFGYAFLEDLMAFISAGPAVSSGSADFFYPGDARYVAPARSAYSFGWAAGIGAEYKLTNNVGVKAEYLHVQTAVDYAPTGSIYGAYGFHDVANQDIYRVGVNYFFDPGAAKAGAASNISNKGTFSGPYAGINLGFSHANFGASPLPGDKGYTDNADCNGPCYAGMGFGSFFNEPSVTDTGVTGGGQAGFNWQNGKYVWGVEADLNGTDHKVVRTSGTSVGGKYCQEDGSDPNVVCSSTEKTGLLATVRARAGYMFMENLMGYVTAGPAVAHSSADFIAPGNPSISAASNPVYGFGWAAGVGVEYKLTNYLPGVPLGVKGEYLHVQTATDYALVSSNDPYTFHSHIDQDIFRVGMNYYFR